MISKNSSIIKLRSKKVLVALLTLALVLNLAISLPVIAVDNNRISASQSTSTKLTASMFKVNTSPVTYKAKTVKKTVKTSLKLNKDYTLSYKNNLYVGTAKIIIKGKGKYTGTLVKTFKIVKPTVNFKPVVKKLTMTKKTATVNFTTKPGYKYAVSISSNRNFKTLKKAYTTKGTVKFTGLKSGTKYYVKVVAYKQYKTNKKTLKNSLGKYSTLKAKKTLSEPKNTTPEMKRLNTVSLSPKKCLKGSSDTIMKRYLKKIITNNEWTNYTKAKKCYDYLINHTYYAYGGYSDPIRSVLVNGFGTCTEYSYTYMCMMKYLGFNARTVWGRTSLAGGGYGQHMWVEVVLNGKVYVFDPQVDDNITGGGALSHDRFCKTYSEVSGQYIK